MRLDRRRFLQLAGASAITTYMAPSGFAIPQITLRGKEAMPHELPPLPYAYDALEPHYDEATVRLHHDKHHATYVQGLNTAEDQIRKMLQAKDFAAAKAAIKAAAFNGSGHILHSIFWTNMKPGGGGQPQGELGQAINSAFDSFEAFKGFFLAAANSAEGSGWGVLACRPMNKTWKVCC